MQQEEKEIFVSKRNLNLGNEKDFEEEKKKKILKPQCESLYQNEVHSR